MRFLLILFLSAISAFGQASFDGASPPPVSGGLPSGAVIDLEAKNISGTDGQQTNRWIDVSGNHFDFYLAASSNSYKTNTATHPAWYLAGVNFGWVSTNTAYGVLSNVAGATIICTVKSEDVTSYHNLGLISKGTSASSSRAELDFPVTAGQSSIDAGGRRLDADTFQDVLGPGVLTGQRYIVAAVFDYANTKLTTYTNAVQLATTSSFQTAGNTSATASQSISAMWDGAAGTYQGPYENFIVWPRALTPTEVTAAYNALK